MNIMKMANEKTKLILDSVIKELSEGKFVETMVQVAIRPTKIVFPSDKYTGLLNRLIVKVGSKSGVAGTFKQMISMGLQLKKEENGYKKSDLVVSVPFIKKVEDKKTQEEKMVLLGFSWK